MDVMEALPLDLQLVAQTILYFTSVALGLVIAIPTGITTDNFGGQCILYGSFDWVNGTSFSYKFGSLSTCDFLVYLNVFASIFYALGMGIYHLYAVCRRDKNIGTQMWVMPFLFINSVVTVVIFIAACVVSVGFSQWCQSFMTGQEKKANIKSCRDGQATTWNWNVGTPGKHSKIYAGTYFDYMTVVQTACWVAFFIWLAQFILCVIRMLRNRWIRLRDSYYDEPTDRGVIVNEEPTA